MNREPIREGYKTLLVLAGFLFSAGGALFLYLDADWNLGTYGHGPPLKADGEFSLLGLLFFGGFSTFAALFFIPALRTFLGLPTLKSDGERLLTYTFPFRKIRISDIDRIDSSSREVETLWYGKHLAEYFHVQLKDGRHIKINVGMVRDPYLFFDRLEYGDDL